MGADEEGTLAQLKACRRELIDPGITTHRGRIVKTTGRPTRVYALSADAVAALPKAEVVVAPQVARQLYQRRNIVAAAVAGVLIVAGGLWWLWPSPQAPPTTAPAPAVEKPAASS